MPMTLQLVCVSQLAVQLSSFAIGVAERFVYIRQIAYYAAVVSEAAAITSSAAIHVYVHACMHRCALPASYICLRLKS